MRLVCLAAALVLTLASCDSGDPADLHDLDGAYDGTYIPSRDHNPGASPLYNARLYLEPSYFAPSNLWGTVRVDTEEGYTVRGGIMYDAGTLVMDVRDSETVGFATLTGTTNGSGSRISLRSERGDRFEFEQR